MGLLAPATGQLDYPTQFDAMFHILDSSAAVQAQPNTFTSSNTFSGASSTVTVSQDLNLSYVPINLCLATNASHDVFGQACGGGGSANIAFFNGTSGNPGVAVSSPTGGANFDSTTMLVTLQGPSTAFITIKTSSITAQGNTFNGASQLVQTDVSGHIPTAVIGTGVILSTGSLQAGATFYVSSGTANSFQASSATISNLLQVPGTGASGQTVVGQIAGSALNVLANGQVGLGTAIPGTGYGLDEQTGTANFALGINTSSMTVSSITVSGKITYADGSVQVTAPLMGASSLAVSSGSATSSVIVTSPTINVVADSTTFKTTLSGSATAFITVNFAGGGIKNTLLAADANGNIVSTTTSGGGGGPTLAANQTWTGSNQWTNPAVSTFTYGLQAGSMTIKNLSNTVLAVDSNGVVISTTVSNGGGPTLSASQTWTGQNNWTTPLPSTFTYGVAVGSLTITGAFSDSGATVIGENNGLVGTVSAPTFSGVTTALKFTATQSTNQLSFTGAGGGNQIRTVSVSPTTTAGEVITLPDTGGSTSVELTEATQTVTAPQTFKSTVTIVTNPNAIYAIFIGTNAPTVAGTQAVLSVSTMSNVSMNGGLTVNGVVSSAAGSLTAPDYSFKGTTNTGITGQVTPTTLMKAVVAGVRAQTWTATGVGILGTTTNDSAAVGDVGESTSSAVDGPNFPASGNFGDLGTLTLTAGDWDITAMIQAERNTATWSTVDVGIGTTAGNSTAGMTLGHNRLQNTWANSATTPSVISVTIANYRVSINGSITYYFKYEATYSAGTPAVDGSIMSARRVR